MARGGLAAEIAKRRAAVSEDRRAVLEAIAFGSDREVKPVDRLRALELLRDRRPSPSLSCMGMISVS